jgi:exosortase C (VPDSG-CTERM-specific)
MSKPSATTDRPSAIAADKSSHKRLIGFVVFVVVITGLMSRPLFALFQYILHSDLYSYTILVPAISGYLIYVLKDQLPKHYSSSIGFAAIAFACGLSFILDTLRHDVFERTSIALAFVSFVICGGFLFLGRKWMKAAIFPFAFLFFIVPLPDFAINWLEQVSKVASADAANLFIHLTGTPVLRDGTVFQLPGIAIEVAQECSGIRSSWVLIIASTLAAYLFLRKRSNRFILVLAAIPLGILRNGFRIMVIAMLCIHIGPHMIHSPIHRQGGPIFFVLSLVPLFFLLWALGKAEQRKGGTQTLQNKQLMAKAGPKDAI